jgi:hypothetical protein
MIEIPKGGNCQAAGVIGWFFQYGRWDLRFNCPVCNQLEAFMLTLAWVNDDGEIIDPGTCLGCGCQGPFKLLDFRQEYLDRADEREKAMARVGGGSIEGDMWQMGSDKNLYQRKLPW